MKSIRINDTIHKVIQKNIFMNRSSFILKKDRLRYYEGVVLPEGITAPFLFLGRKRKDFL